MVEESIADKAKICTTSAQGDRSTYQKGENQSGPDSLWQRSALFECSIVYEFVHVHSYVHFESEFCEAYARGLRGNEGHYTNRSIYDYRNLIGSDYLVGPRS